MFITFAVTQLLDAFFLSSWQILPSAQNDCSCFISGARVSQLKRFLILGGDTNRLD